MYRHHAVFVYKPCIVKITVSRNQNINRDKKKLAKRRIPNCKGEIRERILYKKKERTAI